MALASVQMQVSQILIKYLTTKQPNQTINVLFYYCLSYNLSLFKIDSTYLTLQKKRKYLMLICVRQTTKINSP